MAIEKNILYDKVKIAFPDADIIIVDLAGDNDHYRVEIKSNLFLGKSRIAQHKMVNIALEDCLGKSLHALQIKTNIKEN